MTLKVTARATSDAPAQTPKQSIAKAGMDKLVKAAQTKAGARAPNYVAAKAHELAVKGIEEGKGLKAKRMGLATSPTRDGFQAGSKPHDPMVVASSSPRFQIKRLLEHRHLILGDVDKFEQDLMVMDRTQFDIADGRHPEGAEWYKKKGAMFLFHGTEGPGTNEPYLSLYFQRYPTQISFSTTSNIAEQNIAGQSGTSLQNLGSTATKVTTELMFHDAWIDSKQVTTSVGLSKLDAIIKFGWKYKLFFQWGINNPVPVVLNSIKVTAQHFVASGQIDAEGTTFPPSSHNWDLKNGRPGYSPDQPQVATVSVEMTLDESQDVVVPFVKRAPVKKTGKPKQAPICFSPEEISQLKTGEVLNSELQTKADTILSSQETGTRKARASSKGNPPEAGAAVEMDADGNLSP